MSTCTLQLSVSFPYSTYVYSLEPTAALALRRQSGRGCARGRSLTEALDDPGTETVEPCLSRCLLCVSLGTLDPRVAGWC